MEENPRCVDTFDRFSEMLSDIDKYKIIFDKLMDLILLCDAQYNIIESNRAANIILGQGENVVGNKCYELLHNKKNACMDCPLKDTIKSGAIIPLVVYDERFGEYFEERTHPVTGQNGRLDGFILVSRNVTKSREMEEKSAKIKKLSALGQISSGVAHDFNNVLTVVLGRVQLLKRQITNPYHLNSLNMIEKSALDGAAKVRKIQEFSRPKQDNLTETIDLKKLVEETVEITRPKWDTASKVKGILIEPILNLEGNLYILGNSSDLRNAFTNIIFNAVDAMPDGGIIAISGSRQLDVVTLVFRDTGIGMTPEVIEKIYDPFFTTKEVGKGTGLGMSEVYGIIKRHKGRIDIDSQLGRGSSFIITYTSIDKIEEKVTLQKQTETVPSRILVIDDEEYVIEVLNDILTEFGHRVTSTTSALDAIEKVRQNPFEIVITDLGLPHMNGYQIAREVKNINSAIQVILVTGWAVNILEDKKMEKTVDFIVNKPFSIEKVAYTISEAVSRSKALKESD
jgi:signal transduction histidine kinase/CheY-like chemotaxis protein